MHHAHSGRGVHCVAGLAVPAVFDADKAVRQCAGLRLAVAQRKMPDLRVADFADVSAGGIGDGTLVCGLLP